jgi:glycosyltransferase 2 family protein
VSQSSHRWRLVIRGLLSLAVSGLFVWFSLRHTDLRSVVSTIVTAPLLPVFGYLLILLLVHLVKTLRWGLLLQPLGKVGFRRLNTASAVGFMLTVLLPLRLGELARPLLVSRPTPESPVPLRRGETLATVVVERIIDSLAMGVLAVVSLHVLATTGNAAQYARQAAMLVTAGFSAVCVALTLAFLMRDRAVVLIRSMFSLLSPRLGERLARLVDGFILGLRLGSVSRVTGFFLLTVFYWSLHVIGFWLVARAFGLELSLLMAGTVLACQVVGIMIPAGPGMVGTSQFFTQLGVSIFIAGALTGSEVGVRTAAYANTIWLLQFGQQVLLGLIFLVAGSVSLQGLFKLEELKPRSGDPRGASDGVH